jgi:hypothetical protein
MPEQPFGACRPSRGDLGDAASPKLGLAAAAIAVGFRRACSRPRLGHRRRCGLSSSCGACGCGGHCRPRGWRPPDLAIGGSARIHLILRCELALPLTHILVVGVAVQQLQNNVAVGGDLSLRG